MKRLYSLVSISETPDGFTVLLDGRPVKTPARKTLLAPKKAIADLVMQEWAAQGETVKPEDMPITQWLITMQDLIKDKRPKVETEILNYIDTDFICYFADAEPYATRQAEAWGQAIKWAEEQHALKIRTTSSLQPIAQEAKTHAIFTVLIKKLNDLSLTIFQSLLEDTGSFILTAAFMDGALTSNDLWRAVFIDDLIRGEIYMEDLYGAAPDQEKKRERLRRNFEAAEQLLHG